MLAENLENLVKKERLEGRQEGEQVGIQKGRQEGRQEGERYGLQKGRLAEARDVLRTQLGLKFGEVPDWVDTQLMQADHEQLQQWMRDVLFADRLDVMFTR